jgi:hypothetical protein
LPVAAACRWSLLLLSPLLSAAIEGTSAHDALHLSVRALVSQHRTLQPQARTRNRYPVPVTNLETRQLAPPQPGQRQAAS